MKFTFKIFEKIKEAWPIYKKHFGVFFLLTVIYLIVSYASPNKNFWVGLVAWIVWFFIFYVWVRFILNIIKGKDVSGSLSKEMLPTLHQFWNFIKTMVLLGVIVTLGFVFFIVPGIYFAGRLVFTTYLSVENNKGGRATIKDSWSLTKGYGWNLFWKSFLIGLFAVLGFVALFVGAFITYPMAMIVLVMLYVEFSKFKSSEVITPKVEVVASQIN